MIIIVVFDNVGGFSCRYFGSLELFETSIRRLEPNIPISNHEAELPLGCKGLYVVSRHVAAHRWTWIGSYTPVPRRIKARDGDFCGVGLWLCDVEMSGARLHQVLEPLTDKLERLMAESSNWKTDLVDVEAIGINDAMAARLSSKARPLASGAGIDFEQLEATAAFAYRDGDGRSAVVRALDHSQTGAGLHRLSRVLIPKDDETSLHIRVPGPRLGVAISNEHIYDLLTHGPRSEGSREVPAASAALLTAQNPFDVARSVHDTKPTLHSGPDPIRIIEKLRQDFEDQIANLHEHQDRTRRSSQNATIAAAIAAIGFVAMAAWLGWRAVEMPEATRPVAAREAPRDPEPIQSPLLDAIRPASADPRMLPTGDLPDPYARLDISVTTIASLLEAGSLTRSDDTRRRLQKAFQSFVDVLQQSPEPKIKAIGDRARPLPIDSGRPPFRN